jgi:signal transduction histidine kinase
MKASWKRFAASVTAFANRYRADQFRRTEFAVILLEVAFAVILVGVVWESFTYLQQGTLEKYIAQANQQLAAGHSLNLNGGLATIRELQEEQSRSVAAVATMVLAMTALFGYALARFTLIPTRHAYEAQKQFVGNIAHELRTPLSIIKTNTEVALLGNDLNTETRATFENTNDELDRISNIINNLLSLSVFTRPERMTFANVDLTTIVASAYKKLEPLATRRNQSVSFATSGNAIVWGNAVALEQIVMNLLKNAMNYTPKEGSIIVSIHRSRRHSVELSVTDTGVGIAPKDLARIFEPFYRAESSRARPSGSGAAGLGLTIVSELVKLHHGTISITSELSRGTTATIRLPRGKKLFRKEWSFLKSDADDEMGMDFSAQDAQGKA